MLKRVMVVVLLGCVGLTAGVALGTLFPSQVIHTSATNTTCLWCPQLPPSRLIHSGLPMGGYVLLGLLAGLSAAVGFLVPPRSRLTKR
jgi:hypothetical protein